MAPLIILMLVCLASVYGTRVVPEKSYLPHEARDVFRRLFQSTGRISEDKACTDCLKFLGDIKNVMASPQFAAQIASKVDMGCALLGPAAGQCKQMVTALVHSYLTFMSNFNNPDLVCKLLAFCLPVPPPVY